ncbi:hypothetical protein [Ohtaekwangia koreensis]|uniref:Uncharacterized protein n=1 Tax=Ohtaekwangia koreensis TaxID=688867 RepID=A0A1T5J857_9BACT|nr:hypothetical protein [Ohtaekwangia koreensis]SKC47433.1 hypothetical protein SAMN05660236_0849 [Ohtaekwangia koreensis]
MEKDKPGNSISKQEFQKMRKKFDDKNPGKTQAVIFDKEIFKHILDNPATDKVAIYMGEYDDDTNTVMAVGLSETSVILYETAANKGQPCPPYCGKDQ